MKHKEPAFLTTLTDEQLAGKERIDYIPAAFWVGANPTAVAQTHEADSRGHFGRGLFAVRSPKNPTWRTLRVWKDLTKLGFVMTTETNYKATRARMGV